MWKEVEYIITSQTTSVVQITKGGIPFAAQMGTWANSQSCNCRKSCFKFRPCFFALHSSMREEKEEFQDTKYSVWLLPEAIDNFRVTN